MSLALHEFRNKHIFWNDVGDKLQYADAVCSLANYQRGHFKMQCKNLRDILNFFSFSAISFIKATDLNNRVVYIKHVTIYRYLVLKIETDIFYRSLCSNHVLFFMFYHLFVIRIGPKSI